MVELPGVGNFQELSLVGDTVNELTELSPTRSAMRLARSASFVLVVVALVAMLVMSLVSWF